MFRQLLFIFSCKVYYEVWKYIMKKWVWISSSAGDSQKNISIKSFRILSGFLLNIFLSIRVIRVMFEKKSEKSKGTKGEFYWSSRQKKFYLKRRRILSCWYIELNCSVLNNYVSYLITKHNKVHINQSVIKKHSVIFFVFSKTPKRDTEVWEQQKSPQPNEPGFMTQFFFNFFLTPFSNYDSIL